MPTPYGSRGGMAFAPAELRVLRRALALALHPSSATVQDVQDCHRLAESVDDAAREGARFRAFLFDDLARYRAALPGTATGYLALLGDALEAAYRPGPDDFAALRALRGSSAAAALLDRCRAVLEESMSVQLADRAPFPTARAEHVPGTPAARSAVVPASRRRLQALPGGLCAADPPEPSEPQEPAERPDTEARPDEEPEPAAEPEHEGEPKPRKPGEPGRPVPTPAEVFPPKRKPAPPPNPPEQRAAG
ncbi:hypothetical protein GCM10018793_53620 [Streptomyces sulfonofaciens]|uniref:Uncharacterized protein n=1 Tax=Streptomyces sulfonofaciens TaxID=68272 RepID=A0A919L680_9ACTN|nr:hypothetical protein [Streptomyces sulfonofaciens]GHH85453.1 hypothetical protein GCM10018793_53620 [Streptomyces sulfonofaciens]